ncbi:hypothetical protein PLICRDRAFT_643461 [Plicaturopsis crispa FD-325 SS-3]|nr:hypothetical protein PLICRDRAFT_643461 [Plicaturopsis crispa FD-325 SS-3]
MYVQRVLYSSIEKLIATTYRPIRYAAFKLQGTGPPQKLRRLRVHPIRCYGNSAIASWLRCKPFSTISHPYMHEDVPKECRDRSCCLKLQPPCDGHPDCRGSDDVGGVGRSAHRSASPSRISAIGRQLPGYSPASRLISPHARLYWYDFMLA